MVLQLIVDGLLTGSILALAAVGLTLALGILRFANFAHAEISAIAAYGVLAFLIALGGMGFPIDPFSFGINFVGGSAFAVVVTVAVALAVDRIVFRRLRLRGAHPLILAFASFGVALVLRSILLMIFGPDSHYYTREIQLAVILPFGIRVVPDQLLTLGTALVALVGLSLFLNRTRAGLVLRCVTESPTLSGVSGMNVEAAFRLAWIIVAALAALAGILFGLTVQIRPEMGMTLLLPVFTAMILGGIGSIGGAVLAGLMIGVAESLSILVIPTSYRSIVPFAVLMVTLAIRPAGLFGKPH